ncbi:hypothetical protein JYK14_06890 [Siccirubricoccus sp. KC 17139]|uniref:Uncharacterized protein n=1 Tax=Siccirubricoccus soli TaxID=2899147 RepID=A0ABT1D1Y1_9PROT|nr:hypothetical protein [Siccirubricoccus soli]MCO6415902.1 hypothetical protein [Siccirubricoccus soli]MCP2682034.1 hypothetical protein [Siccirubricoccus soli]
MTEPSALPLLTRHALSRCAARGITPDVASILLHDGDLAVHAGEGCTTVRLGRDTAAMLVAEGADPDAVARARRLAAVLGEHGVVTILRPRGQAGRRYRRQLPTRAQQAA